MSHPCADMIKSSLHFDTYKDLHYFLRNNDELWNQFWIMNDLTRDEEWWNGHIERIRRRREWKSRIKERSLMDGNDYDVETGRTGRIDDDDSETEDDVETGTIVDYGSETEDDSETESDSESSETDDESETSETDDD
jgi:hypothetical protein